MHIISRESYSKKNICSSQAIQKQAVDHVWLMHYCFLALCYCQNECSKTQI